MRRYSIMTTFGAHDSVIKIIDCGTKGYCSITDYDNIVWSRPITPEEYFSQGTYPDDVREEYERLLDRGEFLDEEKVPPTRPNVVELIADGDCAWDQPCIYGYRVEEHAVYCHNEGWLYAPRKCHRCKDWPHEKCRGFKPNPAWAKADLKR